MGLRRQHGPALARHLHHQLARHLFGTRRYETTDDSRNNWLLALITLGEGWHNNHHHYQSSANQGFFWWEVDLSYYALKVLSWVGVVWDLRKPPAHIRDALPPTTDRAGEGPRVAA